MTNVITESITVFHASDGTPLDNGKIYIGADGLNPETNPAQVYADAALTITIAQPIRTVAGRPVNDNGAATALYLSGDYSITVKDQDDQLISSELSIEAVGVGDMRSANNLSDVASISTARTNLGIPVNVINKSAAYTAVAADRSKVIRGTATMTLDLTAAVTLGDGWFVRVIAAGGDVTVDPNGSETIDGATTLVIEDGESAFIACNGTAFFTDRLISLLDGKQPLDADLTAIAGLSGVEGDIIYRDGSQWQRLAKGSYGKALVMNSGATAPEWGAHPVYHLRDRRTSGTAGDSRTGGTWSKHTLQTEEVSGISGASLASSVATLPAGTYKINAWVDIEDPTGGMIRLRNTTDGSTVALGRANTGSGTGDGGIAVMQGQFTIAASKGFELQVYSSGAASTPESTGEDEVYADLYIEKVG